MIHLFINTIYRILINLVFEMKQYTNTKIIQCFFFFVITNFQNLIHNLIHNLCIEEYQIQKCKLNIDLWRIKFL